MRLTKEEVRHIAGLSRIKLSPEEEEEFGKNLSSVLDYIKKLNELDTTGVEPLFKTISPAISTRPDEHRSDFVMDEKLDKSLIGQAPHSENRFIKVKSVISKNK